MSHLEQHLYQGEEYLKASRPDLAIPEFEKALELAPSGTQRMRLGNTLARVFELQGQRDRAAYQFLQTLEEPIDSEASAREQRAIALNNLGRLSLPDNPEKAIGFFDEAIRIFEELSEGFGEFRTHLAHTHMARGEAYYLREKFWYSKKDYKAAIELQKQHADSLSDEMLALAHYQLGAIYADEFNGHDARSHYRKALNLYSEAMAEAPEKYRPLVAACLNNLAVTLIQMEEYDKALSHYEDTLKHYKTLSADRPEVFGPYLASTYSNIGVLFADKMKKYSEAYQANENALTLYRKLSETHPERYTHYLATAYHNAGIYTLETPSWPEADSYLSRALSLRKDLEEKQPGVFRADYCATALNLMEFYQRKLEEEKHFDSREKGLKLLKETAGFLQHLPDLPATENMKSDFDYFDTYFHAVDEEQVRTLDILQKIRMWDQEIDSTLEVDEKSVFQARILEELRSFYRDYPGNTILLKPYVLALNNRAWLHLCKGEVPEARPLLEEGLELDRRIPALLCNKAHCELLDGNIEKAGSAYRELFGLRNESGKDFREVIEKDLLKLESYGVLTKPARELISTMEILAGGSAPL